MWAEKYGQYLIILTTSSLSGFSFQSLILPFLSLLRLNFYGRARRALPPRTPCRNFILPEFFIVSRD